jgi:dCMP deaminase
MKSNIIELYKDFAERVALESKCTRRKVGCVIVRGNSILSYGWNGTPSGLPNKCECDHDGSTLPTVLHAEQNALMKIAKSNETSEGASMFVTLSPCVTCSLLIKEAGITDVYYTEEYRDLSGVELLKQSGIRVTKI